jgi:uncharacterized protein (UPF0128 family)
MFSGYIELNQKNNDKYLAKTEEGKWFLVDKIFRNDNLDINEENDNLENIGIINCFYLPKSIKSKNISYDNHKYWQSKVQYDDNNSYIFNEINEKIFYLDYIDFISKNIIII